MAFCLVRGAGPCPNPTKEEEGMLLIGDIRPLPLPPSHRTGPGKIQTSFFRDFKFSCAKVKFVEMSDFALNPQSELWNVHLTFSVERLPFLTSSGQLDVRTNATQSEKEAGRRAGM